jgi:hypothetical protein
MTSPQPVDDVVACDVHEAYRVQFDALEDIDWATTGSPDAASALKSIIGEGEAEVLQLLKWETTSEFVDQVNYAGLFGDGTIHGAVTVSRQPQGDAWAVTHVVVCTLEEVPPEEVEEADEEFGYLEDDDLFDE